MDDADLKIDNKVNESTNKIIHRAQAILTAWHQALHISGGELKLEKCYWTLQYYVWRDNVATLRSDKTMDLCLNIEQQAQKLPYIPPHQSRTLVGASTNPANDNSTIHALFQSKLNQHVATLQPSNLSTSET